MNTITIHNYEAFLLDSVEGNLAGEQQLELDVFLIQHPELCIDLEDMSSATFHPQQSCYNDKAHLKKTETDLVSEDHLIAYVEEQLPAEEKKHIERSCALNPLLAKELEVYKHTIASADVSVVFENKEHLKRKSKVIWFNFSAAQFAAAASVALLLSLYFLWPVTPNGNEKPNSYANNSIKEKIDPSISHSVINNNKAVTIEKKLAAINSSMSKQKNHITITSNNSVVNITANTTTINITQPDTLSPIAVIKEPGIAPEKEPVVIAESIHHKTIVDVISENDDEAAYRNNKKQGFWSLAGKALKKLNKAGVKSVDGEEDSNDATYALTLGGLNIIHKSN